MLLGAGALALGLTACASRARPAAAPSTPPPPGAPLAPAAAAPATPPTPPPPEAYLAAAEALDRGDAEQAWHHLDEVLADAPTWPQLHADRRRLALARVLASGEPRWRERLEHELSWLEREGPPGAAEVARLQLAYGEHRSAPAPASRRALRAQLEQAIAGGLPPAAERTLREIEGDLALEEGTIGAAIEHYRAALAVDPEAASPHAHLALALGRLRHYAAALDHLERALLDPTLANRVHLQAVHAVLLAQQARFAPAEAVLARAQKMTGADPGAQLYVVRAQHLVATARLAAATTEVQVHAIHSLLDVGDRYLELLPQVESRGDLAALRRAAQRSLPALGERCSSLLSYDVDELPPDTPLCRAYGPAPPSYRTKSDEVRALRRRAEQEQQAAERERRLELEQRAREAFERDHPSSPPR